MNASISIAGRSIGPAYPAYVIAELSANHNGDIARAFAIMAAARDGGCEQLMLLHCISGYPTAPKDANLRTIDDMRRRFGVEVGLSDHTLGTAVATAAVALGATAIEKHVTLRRSDGGPDSAFSLEPDELARLVADVRDAWAALGGVNYTRTESEKGSLVFRRSIFAVADIAEGEVLTEHNIRIIRPGHGLAPKHLPDVLGWRAARAILRGTPIDWAIVEDETAAHI